MHHLNTIIHLILLLIISSIATSSQAKSLTKGLTATLISPISPRSPMYPQILEANNIPTTHPNVTLDRTHYMKWFLSQTSSMSPDEFSDTYTLKGRTYHVTDIYLGDPVQLVYGIFDTGSDIIWFQCDGRAGEGEFMYYNQSKSTTYKNVDCEDIVKCDTTTTFIKGCHPDGCRFEAKYADRTYAYGAMSTDIVSFKPDWEILQGFEFGCSHDNSDSMMGIIGASNSNYALPKQIFPDDPKFSYCIPSDLSKTSFVKFGPDANLTGQNITLFRNNHINLYYMDVVGIQVNGQDIDSTPSIFQMSDDGGKGFIIDSATTMTTLTSVAFSSLKDKVEQLLGKVQKYAIFDICYDSWWFGSHWPFKSRPKIAIKFRNYVFVLEEPVVWEKIPNTKLECLMVLKTWSQISILGYEQLRNVNVGHDPKNNLLYLQRMDCPTLD